MASTPTQTPQKGATQEKKEKVLFSKKLEIELEEKDKYSDVLQEWIILKEARLDGKAFPLMGDKNYAELLESLRKKIEILKYITDGSFETMKKEIWYDILEIVFKLEKKDRF